MKEGKVEKREKNSLTANSEVEVGAGLDELQNFPVNGELDREAIDPDYLVADLQPESAKSQKCVSLSLASPSVTPTLRPWKKASELISTCETKKPVPCSRPPLMLKPNP